MFQTFDETAATGEVAGRVAGLRQLLTKAGVAAFLVPRGDEHRGEYVAPASERLKWLTAFSGSAGMAVIATRKAALFVDGRYRVQARQQTDIRLFEIRSVPDETLSDWLIETLGEGDAVGFDPWLHSIDEIELLGAKLKLKGISLKALARNPIDRLWGVEQPPPPANPIIIQPLTRAGRKAEDKIGDVQTALADAGHDAVVLTMPDTICWLFNIRGSDVAHTPVVLAFAIVPRRGKPELFIDPERLDGNVLAYLKPLARLSNPAALKARMADLKRAGKLVRLSPQSAAYWFARQLGGAKRIARGADPCLLPKAIKNRAEIKGIRQAHARDAVAMCRFLAWFDREAASGRLDEIAAVRQLEDFRRETGKLKEISFDTIAGSGPHGAIVHYRVNVATNRQINKGELFLIDSGGQYADGTTDITRTIAVGTPSAEMRRHFTLVLKGHIAIATAMFPKGTRGMDLDPFARAALWRHGLDFDHGTGHGVGSYLSVHEGPQSISKRGEVALQPGMVISNEPGYYKEGAYGIRIENLVLVEEPAKPDDGERDMLSFETLTFAPIDRRLIDSQLLSKAEVAWINDYHGKVRVVVSEALEPADRDWLEAATAPLR